jgi:uncharacterized protein (UPF0218 family)
MKLTPRLRRELKKPLGPVTKDGSELPAEGLLVSVGDTASDSLLSKGFKPKLVVYDGRTGRRQVGVSKLIESYDACQHQVSNPPGHLMGEVFTLFSKLLESEGPQKVYVEGEEDLTALAAIKEASPGTLVVYGQPGVGLVVVEVNEESKDKVMGFIEEMEDGR